MFVSARTTAKTFPGKRQSAQAWTPDRGSEISQGRGPSLPGVLTSSGTCQPALPRTPPTDAVFLCPALRHIGSPFHGRPWRGSCAFLRSCSACDGSGDSWLRFSKARTMGKPPPPTSSAASRPPDFFHSTKKSTTPSPSRTKTVFYDCRFLNKSSKYARC